LSLWPWQEAVKAVVADRVNVVSVYNQKIHSPSSEMALPSVISLKEYIPTSRRPAFTRFNVFLRDRFACQYCGDAFPTHDLTFDHVIPRSRGGRTTWDNVVTACSPCNLPHKINMHPLVRPTEPTSFLLQEHGRAFPPNYLHESWRDFLYWDSELEQA
jgi:5-methylcytosine-specific restriction endonuclease McrA